MRLGTDWLDNPPAARVNAALQAKGSRLFVVGGHIRDTLLGQRPRDMDFATDALPDVVVGVGRDLGCKVLVHGLQFGTVSLISDDLRRLDITTFRKDIKTDGRHAAVTYTTDMALDARRRDFTVNTLYLDDTGRVHDPTGNGLHDLKARRVRFVGQPARRIEEDSLRALRFFRFNAQFGNSHQVFDRAAMQAIQDCDKERLAHLSGYRVTGEMLRMMQIPDPIPTLEAMQDASILAILFPEIDFPCLRRLMILQQEWESLSPELARLYLLGRPAPFRRIEVPRWLGMTLHEIDTALAHPHPIEAAAYRHDSNVAIAVAHLQAAINGSRPPADLTERIQAGRKARFPITSADIIPRVRTEDIGRTLRRLQDAWIASGFVLTKPDLLALLDDPPANQA